MIDKYTMALNRAMDNEVERMELKGTRSVVVTNNRKGFLAGLEHAKNLYSIFKEDNDGN